MTDKQTVCIIVVDNDGLVLQVSRTDNHEDFGLPGGKVEPGETPLEAAHRELLEETGRRAGYLALLGTVPGRSSTCSVFLAEEVKKMGEPRSGEGVTRWASPETLLTGTFAATNAGVFRLIFRRAAGSLDSSWT